MSAMKYCVEVEIKKGRLKICLFYMAWEGHKYLLPGQPGYISWNDKFRAQWLDCSYGTAWCVPVKTWKKRYF